MCVFAHVFNFIVASDYCIVLYKIFIIHRLKISHFLYWYKFVSHM